VLRALSEVSWGALGGLGPRCLFVGLERACRSLIRLRVNGVLGFWLVEGGSTGRANDGVIGVCWCR
jgi:hypothetical protein